MRVNFLSICQKTRKENSLELLIFANSLGVAGSSTIYAKALSNWWADIYEFGLGLVQE